MDNSGLSWIITVDDWGVLWIIGDYRGLLWILLGNGCGSLCGTLAEKSWKIQELIVIGLKPEVL